MDKNEVYTFEVAIGFTVAADNKHDAMRAALSVENSLNSASVQASYGGTATVIRSKPPTMRRFLPSKRRMPTEPVRREVSDEIARAQAKLGALRFKWRVVIGKDGKSYAYTVTAPTEEQAIEKGRVEFYHDTSHLGGSLQSVKQED